MEIDIHIIKMILTQEPEDMAVNKRGLKIIESHTRLGSTFSGQEAYLFSLINEISHHVFMFNKDQNPVYVEDTER